jgi:hypothetical protein
MAPECSCSDPSPVVVDGGVTICDGCGERYIEPAPEPKPAKPDPLPQRKLLHVVIRQQQELIRRLDALERAAHAEDELVDVAEMARRTGRSRDWLYDHADELGAIRLGSGPKAAINFNPAITRERYRTLAVGNGNGRAPAPQPSRPRKRRAKGGEVELLPIRGSHE